MDFEAICRTCLGTESLDPIFRNKENHERISVSLKNTTGLKVELNDGRPQNICVHCTVQINSSLKFRAKCKDSDSKLAQMCHQMEKSRTEEDLKETVENESEERYIESEHMKTEIGLDSDDEKPPTDLFDKTEYLELDSSSEDLADIDETSLYSVKLEHVAVLENKVTDIKKYKRKAARTKEKKAKEYTSPVLSNLETNIDNLKDAQDPFLTEIDNNTTLNEIKTEDTDLKVVKRRVKCKICKKSLSVRSLDSHMNTKHPGADERKVQCELCDKYILKTKLNRHLNMMHGNDWSKCGYCKQDFSTKELLKAHVASCDFKKRKRKQYDSGKEMSACPECHKRMQRASLRTHRRTAHEGRRPGCDHCGRKFGNKFRLNEHLRSKHGYEKYKCELCAFQSASLLALRNHGRRHRGEKPFICETCGARFHAASLLAQHRQSHRDHKPAKCPLCPAAFKANNSLHMHRAACHAPPGPPGGPPAPPLPCPLCARNYRCRTYLLRHLRTRHKAPEASEGPLEASDTLRQDSTC